MSLPPITSENAHTQAPAQPRPMGPLTVALIAISILVGLWSGLGKDEAVLERLYITLNDSGTHQLPEVLHGEVWRLITPIFIHYGIMHIAFNLFTLFDLGTAIEKRLSTKFLLTFVLVCGVGSNYAQFWFGGPYFGGMSGVVYGLLGFVWIWSTFSPRAGFRLHKQTVLMMLIWFVACWVGFLGPIANYAHTAGLLIGMAWGFSVAQQDRPAEPSLG